MKKIKNINLKASVLTLLLIAFFVNPFFMSCKKGESGASMPVVSYVRITNPDKSDSLITHAFLGNTIAIVGENLQHVREIWFNDQSAYVNLSFITNNCIIVTIPDDIPSTVTSKMLLINDDKRDTLKYNFGVDVPAPRLDALYCEFVDAGKTAIVQGNFFINDPSSPLKVVFPGNIEGTVTSVSLTEVKVTVPSGAGVGPIQMKTIYGSTRSTFYFRDDRNIILNYDNLTNNGVWRAGTKKNDENSLDGNYVMLKGVLDDWKGTEDYSGGGFVSEFWADADGRAVGNFFTGNPANYLLKFEANVKEWTGSYLNICFASYYASTIPVSDPNYVAPKNQIYWANINARGLWRPWEGTTTSTFKTDGWMTVTIPMSDMKYKISEDADKNPIYATMDFDPKLCGSMTFWMQGPAATSGSTSKIEIYIDNVRIVPVK